MKPVLQEDLPAQLPPAPPRPGDAGIEARLLQPDDAIHRQIAIGRGDAVEEEVSKNDEDNNDGMDIDGDDAMGFIGSRDY
jgi:hypothetical protein